MAKSKMKVSYKEPKRQRKTIKEESKEDKIKSYIITSVSVVLFIVLVYLGLYGLEKLGAFDKGYTKNSSEVEFSENNILIGEVFNRDYEEYLVLFDFNGYEETKNMISGAKIRYFVVDMGSAYNKKYIGENANTNASEVNELSINDETLIKITNGRISDYIIGSDNIINYLND